MKGIAFLNNLSADDQRNPFDRKVNVVFILDFLLQLFDA